MKGVYSLIIHIPHAIKAKIGVRMEEVFDKGYWIYVGSAQGEGSTSLENRLRRHFRSMKKTHWHIDYLLKERVSLVDAIWSRTEANQECNLVEQLLSTNTFDPRPAGFGAGDCRRGCMSHLLFFLGLGDPTDIVKESFRRLSLVPEPYTHLKT